MEFDPLERNIRGGDTGVLTFERFCHFPSAKPILGRCTKQYTVDLREHGSCCKQQKRFIVR